MMESWSAAYPPAFCRFGSAPCSSSSCQRTSAIRFNGRVESAICSTSERAAPGSVAVLTLTISTLPVRAARWSGVSPVAAGCGGDRAGQQRGLRRRRRGWYNKNSPVRVSMRAPASISFAITAVCPRMA